MATTVQLRTEVQELSTKPIINRDKPGINSLIDDPAAAHTSVDKLKSLKINTVYPGHGKPFLWEQFLKIAGKR